MIMTTPRFAGATLLSVLRPGRAPAAPSDLSVPAHHWVDDLDLDARWVLCHQILSAPTPTSQRRPHPLGRRHRVALAARLHAPAAGQVADAAA